MRTFAMASILLTTLVPRLRRGAQKPSRAAERTAAFIPSSSAWPAPGATAGSAGRTSSKIPIGPAARCNGAIAAAIKDWGDIEV